MQLDDYRRAIYDVSEAIAPTWERRRAEVERVVTPVREWMLRELAPRDGDTLLELAAGTGETGLEAATLVGERGKLITTDFSPKMLEGARRRGAELGLGNVDYRIMDAERLELETDSVDGVLCRFGFMLMADPGAALSESRRVLRPGGRLVLAVWGAPERNPFFGVAARVLVERGHMPPPDPEGPGISSMASEERTKSLLDNAGFSSVRTEEIPVRFSFDGLTSCVSFVADTAGPIGLTVQRLSEAEAEAFKAQVGELWAPFATSGGYEVPGLALAAVAS